MASKDSFGAKSTLEVDGTSYEIFRLDKVSGDGLDVGSLHVAIARLARDGLVILISRGHEMLHALSPELARSRALADAVARRSQHMLNLESRARLFSERAPAAVGWIDETLRAIRRARREHAVERAVRIRARMHLHHVTPRAIEPGEDHERVADRDAEQAVGGPRLDLDPRVGRALVPLLRRLLARRERRADEADRA